MPGARLTSQNSALTARLTRRARMETLTDALGPKRLQIMSWQRNDTQLRVKPQSSASHGRLTSSLFASRFMSTTLTTKQVTVDAGMLRMRTL